VSVDGSTVTAKVDIGTIQGGGWTGGRAEWHVPGLDTATVETLVKDATRSALQQRHRGNIEVG